MTLPRRFVARSLITALAFGLCAPYVAGAQPAANQTPVVVPTPAPMPTTSGTPIPYPAYGTPAPDVAAQAQKPGVPVTVTLKSAIDIAVAQSPAFASERAAYYQIAAKYGAARGALGPSLSASGSVDRSWGRSLSGASPSPSSGPNSVNGYVTTEQGSVSVSQLIFDGGHLIEGLRSAQFADVAGRDTLLRQLQTLAFTVATNYYALLEDNAAVASDNSLVREFEINEQFVSAEIRTGAAPRSDLAAAQFETAQARGALVTAQGNQIAAQATFATSLGLDADTLIQPTPLEASPPQVKILSYQQALAEAFKLRPDFLAAQATVDSNKANLLYAELGRVPTVTLNGSAGTGRDLVYPNAMTSWSPSGSIGATISLPIWDQGLTDYNIHVAKDQLDQAVAGLSTSRLQVQSDVRGGLAGLISARANLVQAEAEVTSSTVSLQATQAQYKVGASTITAIVTAEANLATAQTSYVQALYGERLAEQQYTYALGSSDLTL
ncbi:MAG TPA: TolC family protein [Candidatus Acidoferrales bacterium]|nr:TolC family protein [Candidatus Acidoferrales bacterium]